MIKTVAPGRRVFVGRCKKCGCEFSYDLSDLHLGCGSFYVHCPCCECEYLHPDQDVYIDNKGTTPSSVGDTKNTPTKPIKAVVKIRKGDKWVPIELTNVTVIKEMHNGASTIVLKPNDMTCNYVFPTLKVGDPFMIEDAYVSDYYVSGVNKEYNTVTLSKLEVTRINLDEYN